MASIRSSDELTERILTELQLALPEVPESACQRLRQRLPALLGGEEVPDAEVVEREATLVMVQLRGVEELTQTFSAAVAVDVLNRFFALMSEVIVRHGGTIERLLGSAVRVVFGMPSPQAEHVEQAVACAVAAQQAMTQFNRQNESLGLPQFYASVAINTGSVLAGALGAYPHREFSVLGEEVSQLMRMEAHGLRGQVVLGENVYHRARDFILVGESKTLTLPGRTRALTVYELLGTTRPRPLTVPRREQRKSPRVAVALPCYFQLQMRGEILEPLYNGEVVDLGYHGLQMASAYLFEPGTDLRLELSPFLFGGRSTYLFARVVSVEPTPGGSRCGLEFLDCEDSGRQAIRRMVDSLVYQG